MAPREHMNIRLAWHQGNTWTHGWHGTKKTHEHQDGMTPREHENTWTHAGLTQSEHINTRLRQYMRSHWTHIWHDETTAKKTSERFVACLSTKWFTKFMSVLILPKYKNTLLCTRVRKKNIGNNNIILYCHHSSAEFSANVCVFVKQAFATLAYF